MKINLNLNSVDDYLTFLKVKALPQFKFSGRVVEFPDEYANSLGIKNERRKPVRFKPSPFLFDYQSDIARLAIKKQKFALFMACGLGKTLVMTEYIRHVADAIPKQKRILVVSPLMVVKQTIGETKRFYGDKLHIEQVRANQLGEWLQGGGGRIGITNYEAIIDGLPNDKLGCLILDESSMLKSHYGKWGTRLIEMGKGVDWKLCATGTPAPNDRIEYANHAVFLDHFPTVNSFLARFFVNRGQTDNRWELKPHAMRPFYRALSHWCIFVSNPGTYGWKDNSSPLPPINLHIERIDLNDAQNDAASQESKALFPVAGGITSRAKLAQIAKGFHNGKHIGSSKPAFIKGLIDSWPDESTIIWCRYNAEQDLMASEMPNAASMSGTTPDDVRVQMIDDFQSGKQKTLITKAKICGFGLNLQICTRMVFSTLQDSYEEYWQAIKRANRVGSTRPLNVHAPITEIERPMVDTVLRKAREVEQDEHEQEAIFKEESKEFINV